MHELAWLTKCGGARSVSLGLVLIAALASCTQSNEPVARFQITMRQAATVSKMVADTDSVRAPMLILFDSTGLLVETHVGWDQGSTLDKLNPTLTQHDAGISIETVRRALGQNLSPEHSVRAVIISFGAACAPCASMEADLATNREALNDAALEIYTVSLRQ